MPSSQCSIRQPAKRFLTALRSPDVPSSSAGGVDVRVLVGLALAHFVNDIYASFLAPLLPLVVNKFNLTLTLAGLLATIFNASAALSQPIFAVLADRMSKRTLVALGPTLTVLGMGVLGLTPSYGALIGVLVLAAMGTASFHPQAASSAGTLSEGRKGTGVSVFVAGGELGYSVGPVLIAVIVTSFGLGSTAWVALPGLVLCGGLWWFFAQRPSAPRPQTGGLRADLRGVWRPLVLLYLAVVCRSIIISSYITFLPLLLRARGGSLIAGGAAVFLFGGIGTIGGVLGGILSDRFGGRKVLLFSLIVGPPMLLTFILGQGPWTYVFLALGGMVLYLSAAVTIVMGQTLLPRQASVASSIVMGLAWGTAGLSLTAVGALGDARGLAQALTMILGLAIVALLSVMLMPKTQRGVR